MAHKEYQEAINLISKEAVEMSGSLDLVGFNLKEIPSELFQLNHLDILYLGNNQLKMIPPGFGNLSKLAYLYLYENLLSELSPVLCKLPKLRVLSLFNNRITKIPACIKHLSNLQYLYLYNNEITEISTSLKTFDPPFELFLSGNTKLGLPAELLGLVDDDDEIKSAPAAPGDILEYYFRTRKDGRALNEAKLILVGKGAVGKTSLVEKLIFGTFVAGKSKTEGINIEQWPLDIAGDQIRLNVWDFGGQEIMHATHQFFLTERSLYLLVLNGREGNEDIDAEYWLKLIESFGANSPVILVLNKISEHAFDLNRSALLKKYPNIKGFVRTDCGDDIGIDELKVAIVEQTNLLDELRVKFPGEWFSVKDELATTKKNFLSFEQYRELCNENGIGIPKHQEMLARYLNQLGIVLNYRDDPRLKDTHILNPTLGHKRNL